MNMWKLKCKFCSTYFYKPESENEIIRSMGVNFCSKGCCRSFIAQYTQMKKDKLRTQNIKKKEKKQNSISSLTKKADILWSECVKIRDWYKCVYCGKKEYLNSHHLFTRARKATRWDIVNWLTLCSGHHTLSSNFSAHQTPLEFFEWFENRVWRTWIDELARKSRRALKVTPDFIKKSIKELEVYKKVEQKQWEQ